MYAGIASLNKLGWSSRTIVAVPALCLLVACTLLACGDGPQPTATVTATPTFSPISEATPAGTPEARIPLSEELTSTKKRNMAAATGGGLGDLVKGNSAFAFDLYRELAEKEGNLFFSPFSISLALAMTYAGARGETERQMAETMHYLLPQERLHGAFNTLDLRLASRGRVLGSDDAGFQLNVANAVWGQRGYEFLEEFLDVLGENYGAGVRPADFAGAPEESRFAINEWVAERTEDRVKDLMPANVINGLTRLVLTNAIYFNATWLQPFLESDTRLGAFKLLDGSEVQVPMMSRTAWLGYAAIEGYQAVDLPYVARELSMTILLPAKGRFRELEDSIDADLVGRILEEIDERNVLLTMPKFDFESQFKLDETLKEMGMPDAFTGNADFTGMSGPGSALSIQAVIHKAFVSVDEEGTEAAAASGVGVMESEPASVTVDRPFIFLIRDKPTGTVLFLGRVESPA